MLQMLHTVIVAVLLGWSSNTLARDESGVSKQQIVIGDYVFTRTASFPDFGWEAETHRTAEPIYDEILVGPLAESQKKTNLVDGSIAGRRARNLLKLRADSLKSTTTQQTITAERNTSGGSTAAVTSGNDDITIESNQTINKDEAVLKGNWSTLNGNWTKADEPLRTSTVHSNEIDLECDETEDVEPDDEDDDEDSEETTTKLDVKHTAGFVGPPREANDDQSRRAKKSCRRGNTQRAAVIILPKETTIFEELHRMRDEMSEMKWNILKLQDFVVLMKHSMIAREISSMVSTSTTTTKATPTEGDQTREDKPATSSQGTPGATVVRFDSNPLSTSSSMPITPLSNVLLRNQTAKLAKQIDDRIQRPVTSKRVLVSNDVNDDEESRKNDTIRRLLEEEHFPEPLALTLDSTDDDSNSTNNVAPDSDPSEGGTGDQKLSALIRVLDENGRVKLRRIWHEDEADDEKASMEDPRSNDGKLKANQKMKAMKEDEKSGSPGKGKSRFSDGDGPIKITAPNSWNETLSEIIMEPNFNRSQAARYDITPGKGDDAKVSFTGNIQISGKPGSNRKVSDVGSLQSISNVISQVSVAGRNPNPDSDKQNPDFGKPPGKFSALPVAKSKEEVTAEERVLDKFRSNEIVEKYTYKDEDYKSSKRKLLEARKMPLKSSETVARDDAEPSSFPPDSDESSQLWPDVLFQGG